MQLFFKALKRFPNELAFARRYLTNGKFREYVNAVYDITIFMHGVKPDERDFWEIERSWRIDEKWTDVARRIWLSRLSTEERAKATRGTKYAAGHAW